MPTYNFRNKITGEEFSRFLSWNEREALLESDQNIEPMVAAPAIISGIEKKPDSGFRDVLKGIKKANIWSKINTY